ncbi:hypothetical protein [Chitinophaga sp. MM2321]|uniref:hypothetical protein n=1 Tax=Chitinophaga sp. MM2321 TaxID=3137178 RepID=UPI0032D595C7
MRTVNHLLITCLLFLLYSCSDKLSTGKAEKMIKEHSTFPEINDVNIEYGFIAYDKDSLPSFYYVLQEKGMFKVEYLGSGGLFVINYRFRVTPTPEAKKFITEEDNNPRKQGNTGEFMYNSRFKTCEVDFNKVESIQEIPAFNAADITYTVKRHSFTPFWNYYLDEDKKMPDTIQQRKFGVVKTNDGWKPAKFK